MLSDFDFLYHQSARWSPNGIDYRLVDVSFEILIFDFVFQCYFRCCYILYVIDLKMAFPRTAIFVCLVVYTCHRLAGSLANCPPPNCRFFRYLSYFFWKRQKHSLMNCNLGRHIAYILAVETSNRLRNQSLTLLKNSGNIITNALGQRSTRYHRRCWFLFCVFFYSIATFSAVSFIWLW